MTKCIVETYPLRTRLLHCLGIKLLVKTKTSGVEALVLHSLLKYSTYLHSSDLRLVTMSERQSTDLRHQSVSHSESTCGSPSFLRISS